MPTRLIHFQVLDPQNPLENLVGVGKMKPTKVIRSFQNAKHRRILSFRLAGSYRLQQWTCFQTNRGPSSLLGPSFTSCPHSLAALSVVPVLARMPNQANSVLCRTPCFAGEAETISFKFVWRRGLKMKWEVDAGQICRPNMQAKYAGRRPKA